MFHKTDTEILWHVQDSGREIDRLCSFLGLSHSAEEKDRVATGVKFSNMKQNKMTNYSTVPFMNQKVSPFMRKGIVKKYLLAVRNLLKPFITHFMKWPVGFSLPVQGKLVTGRTISLWPRMNSLMKTTIRKWRIPHWSFVMRFRRPADSEVQNSYGIK